MVGEQIGFDEGGVLQALATPIFTREVTTEKKLKSGKIKTTSTKFEVTGAHILALAMGKVFMGLFLEGKGKTQEEINDMLAGLPWWTGPGLYGRLAGFDPFGSDPLEEGKSLTPAARAAAQGKVLIGWRTEGNKQVPVFR